jgi:hypothetical protein
MTYQDLPPAYFWRFLVIGYVLTIAIETPILVAGLSRGHALARRLLAGVWLTACTYPIVVLVLPLVVPPLFADPQHGEWAYLAVAETFAPLAECALFSLLVKAQMPAATLEQPRSAKRVTWQDYAAIIAANLASFLGGEWLLKNVVWLQELIKID